MTVRAAVTNIGATGSVLGSNNAARENDTAPRSPP